MGVVGVGRFIQQERQEQEDHDLENDFFTGDGAFTVFANKRQ